MKPDSVPFLPRPQGSCQFPEIVKRLFKNHQSRSTKILHFYALFVYCVCEGACVYRSAHMEVRGQPSGVDSLLPPLVPRIKLRLPGLAVGAFTYCAVPPAPRCMFPFNDKITIAALCGCSTHLFCLLVSRIKPWASHAGQALCH